ncbi:S8 family serine peptidase [Kineococcus sp. SYSU DK002]|uniref:S8 family serine peptidase n=1 Tax=Kineococcus sp. SYSU DK002 TaxID=3383123 RepID=UPI003D7C9987
MTSRKTFARAVAFLSVGVAAVSGPLAVGANAADTTTAQTEKASYDVLRRAIDGTLSVTVQTAAAATETVTQEAQNEALLAGIRADSRVVTYSVPRTRTPAGDPTVPRTNDPLLAQATHLRTTGAFTAWNRTRGQGQVVAVLDTGVAAGYPELRGHVLAQVDVAAGKEIGTHGTSVASLIAGGLNNGVAAAGVAPEASILPVRVCGDDAVCTTSSIANGLIAAVDRGADVVNVSVSGTGASAVEQAAVQYATSRGVTVVAAAGNSNVACDTGQVPEVANCDDMTNYPAAYPDAIAVTSTATGDVLAATTGNHVDLNAPGSKLRAGVSASGADLSLVTGSSFAAAQVSGAVALITSIVPTASPAQVQQVLRSTSRTAYAGSGRGSGLLDVAAAVAAVSDADSVSRVPGFVTYTRDGARVVVGGSILARYDALGAEKGTLGWPLTNELKTIDRLPAAGGAVSRFERGTVFWSPTTGAQVVAGAIGAEFDAMIAAENTAAALDSRTRADVFLGYPTTEEIPLRGGVLQRFQNGSMYWSPATGAHALRGAILEAYGRTGWENGRLGYPVTNEVRLPGGAFAAFERGAIYWSPTTGAHVVEGAIRDAWASTGWEFGYLGYPTSDEYAVPGGVRQNFQGRTLDFRWATGRVTEVR